MRMSTCAGSRTAQAARRIHADGIDILVDLKGYTKDARTEILAHRPAPVQVNFLGYPGSMGADFIDYILADAFVAPMRPAAKLHRADRASARQLSAQRPAPRRSRRAVPSRAQCGLPETAFVFCSFNSAYKITEEMFALWMRLLAAVPGSVLWLLDADPLAKANLRREAATRGVDPGRLVFAPKLRMAGAPGAAAARRPVPRYRAGQRAYHRQRRPVGRAAGADLCRAMPSSAGWRAACCRRSACPS